MFIAINDTLNTWTQGVYAANSGHPLVVIDFGVIEDAGMRLLSLKLIESFPGIPVQHFEQGCSFRGIEAE